MSTTDSAIHLSGFGDEIAPEFDDQLDVLSTLGIESVDLRTVDETSVLELGEDRLVSVERLLDEYGLGVATIGSPIGKAALTSPLADDVERLRRALSLAERLDAAYVRVFSYYVSAGDHSTKRDEVVRRLTAFADVANAYDPTLLLENEKGVYGDTPERCRDLLETVGSDSLRMVFDPGNFLEVGTPAYPDALSELEEYVECLHVKDAMIGEEGSMRLPGEGDARMGELISALYDSGFDGYAALEPHLRTAGPHGGYTGPTRFSEATSALRACLARANVPYR